jgi:hypothetical protein
MKTHRSPLTLCIGSRPVAFGQRGVGIRGRSFFLGGLAQGQPHASNASEPNASPTAASEEGNQIGAVRTEFSEAYYLACYPDVAKSGVDPLKHFFYTGWRERRNPNQDFDTNLRQMRTFVMPVSIRIGIISCPEKRRGGYHDAPEGIDAKSSMMPGIR